MKKNNFNKATLGGCIIEKTEGFISVSKEQKMKIQVINIEGKKISRQAKLDKGVFGIKPNEHCIYLAINSEMSSIRQGTHSSKTRSEVSGSGAKK